MKLVAYSLMFFVCVQSLIASSLIENDLTGWSVSTQNATIESYYPYDAWNTYSLTFTTKSHQSVVFYMSVSPGKYSGGEVWFDNIRGEGLEIENGSFEDCDVTGVATGWDYRYQMYNTTKRHAKQVIGTDFQYASDGLLSMRFFGPAQKNLWKLAPHPAPKRLTDGWKPVHAMSPWRPLSESGMWVWRSIKVEPNTTYTLKMDYRMDKNFTGTIRPGVGTGLENWKLIAHAGWQGGYFQDMQEMRDRFGKSLTMMTINNGQACLTKEISVAPGENYHASLELLTNRIHDEKLLEMDIALVCEDVDTGKIISEDSYHWDGAPGYTESITKNKPVDGGTGVLNCNFASSSKNIRLRITGSGKGTEGKVFLGNVALSSTPELMPPVQQVEWKSATENFKIGFPLTYRVSQGDANAIEGALWLTARDMKEQNIEFTAAKANANVTIAIGALKEDNADAYRLSVNCKGIRIESATPRGSQYALMTLLQLVGDDQNGKFIVASHITDWSDMPLRGVIMESCSHFMPQAENSVRLTDNLYHNMPRQTWSQEDFLQLVRWKINTVIWRSTGFSDRMKKECDRFHIDSMPFAAAISDPPSPQAFVNNPDWIEGFYIQYEEVRLENLKETLFAHKHVSTAHTSILVQNRDKTKTYIEGKDYLVVGEFGSIGGDRKFKNSKPFGIARIDGTKIPNNATVYVSYDYIPEFGAQTTHHYQYCLSHPDAVKYVGEVVKKIAARGEKYILIRGDELSFVGSCSRCLKTGKSPADLLIEHISFLSKKAREGNPDVQVCMWNDSVSPYTTGFKWGFTVDGPAPPGNVWQMVWHYSAGQPVGQGWAEIKLNQKLGLSTIVFPWYNLRNIREWAQAVGEARRRGWNAMGIIDTPWGHPGPYANFKETASVSWKVPAKGEKGWVEIEIDD